MKCRLKVPHYIDGKFLPAGTIVDVEKPGMQMEPASRPEVKEPVKEEDSRKG